MSSQSPVAPRLLPLRTPPAARSLKSFLAKLPTNPKPTKNQPAFVPIKPVVL
jgi:hypothetical protein